MCINTRKLISVEYVFINLKKWLHKYWISQNALYCSGFTQDIVPSYYQNINNYNNNKLFEKSFLSISSHTNFKYVFLNNI